MHSQQKHENTLRTYNTNTHLHNVTILSIPLSLPPRSLGHFPPATERTGEIGGGGPHPITHGPTETDDVPLMVSAPHPTQAGEGPVRDATGETTLAVENDPGERV